MIIKLFLILSVISYILGKKIQQIYNIKWTLFNYFIWLSFFGAYCILEYSHYVNFIIYNIFISVFIAAFMIYYFTFSELHEENIMIWILLILSIITAIALVKILNNTSKIYNSEALIGDKGLEGPRGKDGDILDSNKYYTYNQLVFQVEKTMQKWKKDNNIVYDEQLNYFKNIYFKRALKKICESDQYYNEIKNKSNYKVTKILMDKINSWTLIILKYENGSRFLESYFDTEYHWNHGLLSKDKRKLETQSPFDTINNDPVWNWR